MKKWRVSDSGNSIEEDFATKDEAMAFAQESLDLYREEAKEDGEWSPEVDFLSIYKLTHVAKISNKETVAPRVAGGGKEGMRMGEIADMMLDGTLCEGCGEYLGTDNGFPTRCNACLGDNEERVTPVAKDWRCLLCGKRFATEASLTQHGNAKHSPDR